MSSVRDLHKKLWKPGMGSVTASEAEFLAAEIGARKPRTVLELGTATGLSTVLIDDAVREAGGGEVITVDLNTTFFGDKSKATGYLLDETGADKVRRVTGKTSLDFGEILGETKVDLAFIDAAHWHPWPVVDTLMIWPFLAKDAILFHHDLRLYQKFADTRGLGPKYLFDQFPDACKTVIPDDADANMFYVNANLSLAELGDLMVKALYLPWQKPKIDPSFLAPIRARLEAFYPPRVAEAFETTYQRFL